jgi:uncharacterized integral membrane protein
MQFFLWLAFLLFIGVAVFTIQNSTAPPVVMKFLFWNLETSLIYTILASFASGILVILLLWIPRSIKASFRVKNLKREIEILQKQVKHPVEASKPLEEPPQ